MPRKVKEFFTDEMHWKIFPFSSRKTKEKKEKIEPHNIKRLMKSIQAEVRNSDIYIDPVPRVEPVVERKISSFSKILHRYKI